MPVRSLAVTPDGRVVLSGDDGSAHLGCMVELDAAVSGWTVEQHQQLPGGGELIRTVAVTPDGRVGVAGFSDGRVPVLVAGGTHSTRRANTTTWAARWST